MKEMDVFNNSNLKSNITVSLKAEDVMLDFLSGVADKYQDKLILKGCLALKAQLKDKIEEELRDTRDIDFTVFTEETWEEFVKECCTLASENSNHKLKYTLEGRRGLLKNPNSDSLKISCCNPIDDSILLFEIDMNIKLDESNYISVMKLNNFQFNIYNIFGILTDKLRVVTTQKACRRIKDVIDIFYLATTLDFKMEEVLLGISHKGNKFWEDLNGVSYILDSNNLSDLEHAYNKYRISNTTKPNFEEVYNIVCDFCLPIFSILISNIDMQKTEWVAKRRIWVK